MQPESYKIIKGQFDTGLMLELAHEIKSQFAIPDNPLLVPTSPYNPTGRNLFPDFISDEIFLRLFRYFEWPGFFGCTNGTVSIHEKPPVDDPEKYTVWHTDRGSFAWNENVRAYSVWCPLNDVGQTTAPGLKINDAGEVIFPELSIGDCIIFRNDVVHGTGYYIRQTETRHSIDFRLIDCKRSMPVGHNERVFVHPWERSYRFHQIGHLVKMHWKEA